MLTRALLLAAGRGERLRPLTDDAPKPLLEVGGRALIERHLERLAAACVTDIVVNLAWLGSKIVDRLGDGARYGVSIAYSEEGDALETAGGIVHARALLGDAPFAVVNADVWTDYPFARLALPEGRLAHLVLVPNPDHNPNGDFVLDGDVVQNPSESRREGAAPTRTFSGIAVYSPALFAGLAPGKRSLAPVLRAASERGEISGELYEGDWCDVGTVERLESLRQSVGAAPSRRD
ncbi:MAG: nucleotidyltransferase family protein [Gammaproteobacteria bacterium]